MTISRRIEQLEHILNTGDGVCPHLPPVVTFYEPDGSIDVQDTGRADVAPDVKCPCGRDRLQIVFQSVDNWRGVS